MGVNPSWFGRLTTRLRGRRASPPTVAADAAGLRIGDELIAWTDIRRIEAFKRDVYVGESLCMAVEVDGDRVFEINDACPGWDAALDAVESFLPGSMARAEWTLRLMAAPADRSVAVYAQS
jgi:hypothetical protein